LDYLGCRRRARTAQNTHNHHHPEHAQSHRSLQPRSTVTLRDDRATRVRRTRSMTLFNTLASPHEHINSIYSLSIYETQPSRLHKTRHDELGRPPPVWSFHDFFLDRLRIFGSWGWQPRLRRGGTEELSTQHF
jgi:hypothetical protein